MPTDDSNAKQVKAMESGETRWVSPGAVLRIQTRDKQNRVEVVADEVALSLIAIGTLLQEPDNPVRVTRNSSGYKVYLSGDELDSVQKLRRGADPHTYAIAEVLPH